MGPRPVGVYPNPIFPTRSRLSSILQFTNLYQPGGVSYGADTIQAEYEMIYLPIRSYHISSIYTILPILYHTG